MLEVFLAIIAVFALFSIILFLSNIFYNKSKIKSKNSSQNMIEQIEIKNDAVKLREILDCVFDNGKKEDSGFDSSKRIQ